MHGAYSREELFYFLFAEPEGSAVLSTLGKKTKNKMHPSTPP